MCFFSACPMLGTVRTYGFMVRLFAYATRKERSMSNEEKLSVPQAQDANKQNLQETPSQEVIPVLAEEQLEEVAGAGCFGCLFSKWFRPAQPDQPRPSKQVRFAPDPVSSIHFFENSPERQSSSSSSPNHFIGKAPERQLSSSSSSSDEFDPWTPQPGR
jgi:hypothetical protein